MEEYNITPNSHKYRKEQERKAEERKVEKVVSGRPKKKSEMRKFADAFLAEDISNVKSYILMDVLVPNIKKAVSDIVTNGVDIILYGDAGRSKKRSGSKVAYGSYYDRPAERVRTRNRNDFDYDDVLFETRGDAESVIAAMDDVIEQYKFVSVADLYDLADISTDNYMVGKYGWTDIRSAKAVRTPDGWIIKLPRPLPLD